MLTNAELDCKAAMQTGLFLQHPCSCTLMRLQAGRQATVCRGGGSGGDRGSLFIPGRGNSGGNQNQKRNAQNQRLVIPGQEHQPQKLGQPGLSMPGGGNAPVTSFRSEKPILVQTWLDGC